MARGESLRAANAWIQSRSESIWSGWHARHPVPLVLFLLTLLSFLAWLPDSPHCLDEGLILTGAMRVSNHDLPYRDFWTQYGPGEVVLLSLLFHLFPSGIIATRVVDIAFKIALIGFAFAFSRQVSQSKQWASYTLIVSAIWLSNCSFFSYPVIPALALSFASIWLVFRARESGRARWYFFSGLCAAGCALFRHDFGAYLVAATVVSTCIHDYRRGRGGDRWIQLVLYLSGLAILAAPAAFYLVIHAGLGNLYDELVYYPSKIFPRVRSLPYPFRFVFFFPFLPPLLTVAHYLRRDPWGRSNQAHLALMLSLFGLASFAQVSVRSDELHLLPFYLVALLVLSPALDELALAWPGARRLSALAAILLALASVSKVSLLRRYYLLRSLAGRGDALIGHGVARGRGVLLRRDQALALRKVQELARPGDALFVGNTRHDRVHINDSMFYFLSGLRPATFFHEMDPGLTPTTRAQMRIRDDLKSMRPGIAVLVDHMDQANEPSHAALESGVELLDNYLRAQFEEVARYGDYHVLRRKL
jgi:hypothetical protein